MLPQRWNRIHYIGVAQLVIGLLILVVLAPRFAPEDSTTLAFGLGRDAPSTDVAVAPFAYLVGILWVVAGLSPFVAPLRRVAVPLMVVAGFFLIPASLIISAVGKQTNALTMLSESLRLATPIALGALAGLWSERAGVVNIAVEGMMLMAACFGFTIFLFSQQAGQPTGLWQIVAVLVAILTGALMALLHGWLSITFRTDQVVSGTVINILALGVTAFIRRQFLLEGGGLPKLPDITIPVLSDLPLIGDIFFNNQPIFYLMILLLFLSHFVLFNTRWGLRTRAVGEHPKAAETVGINVIRTRYMNVLLSGMIAGLAGAWFSLETVGKFEDGMTNGTGFIALAAVIFGKWTPFGAFGGAMLFGFADALGARFQLLAVPIPPQFLQVLPYVVTIIVTSGLIGRAISPAALGQPYEKK